VKARKNRLGIVISLVAGISFAHPLPAEPGPDRFAKWNAELAAFEKEDARVAPPRKGIVFVGSSSVRLWKSLAEDFPHHRLLNRGFGGSQLADVEHFADRLVLAYEPRFIVVYAGGNDIHAGRTPEQVFDAFCSFVNKVRARQPDTPIAYLSIAGNPARWSEIAQVIRANGLIEAYTKQNPGLLFIDVFHPMLGLDGLPRPEIFGPDKLHMNPKGYQLWTTIVGPYLPKPDLE
jgi:lysophospholipase L1-like esterase